MKPKILLVDDEPNITQALTKRLRHEDYEILSAPSAEEALQILAREPIDVVVADEQMPGMSGSELLAVVSREYPDTVRIILTGQANLEAAVRAINEGQIYRFLEKPCAAEELAAIIRQAVQQRPDRSTDTHRDTVRAIIADDAAGDSHLPASETVLEAKPQSIFFEWTTQEPVAESHNQG